MKKRVCIEFRSESIPKIWVNPAHWDQLIQQKNVVVNPELYSVRGKPIASWTMADFNPLTVNNQHELPKPIPANIGMTSKRQEKQKQGRFLNRLWMLLAHISLILRRIC